MENSKYPLESLENAVKWDYFKSILGWPTEQIAYEMNWNTRRLLEWTNKRAAIITELLKSDVGKVKAIRKKLEKEYPIPKEKSRKELKLETIQVAKKYKELKEVGAGNLLQELAKLFKCDFNEFRLWWNRNLPVINEQVRRNI